MNDQRGKPENNIVRRGTIFTLEDYGTVKFEGLDFYHGEYTARLKGITHPGTYHPKIEELEKEGFEFIDNQKESKWLQLTV